MSKPNKTEPFYLIENMSAKSGKPTEWWIGVNPPSYGVHRDKWTTNFHEIPEAFKFPSELHARVIWHEYSSYYGAFTEGRHMTVEITEHLMIPVNEEEG